MAVWVLKCLAVLILEVISCTATTVRDVNRTELQTAVLDSKENVVYFYAEWCHACKAFGPIYDAVAKEYSSPGLIQFLKFDGGSDREFAAPLIDDAFPGVALLHGNRLVDRMKAVRTRANLERWIEQMTGEPIEVFSSKEEAEKRSKRYVAAFIASVPSNSSDFYHMVHNFASNHRQWAKWLVVIDPKEEPHINIKHPFEKIKTVGLTTTEELTQWADSNRFPLFGVMDTSNQGAYYETGRNLAMLVGTPKDFSQFGVTFRKLAVPLKDSFSFVWFRSDQESAHGTLSNMMVRTTPAFVVFTGTGNKKEHKRFVYGGNETDLNDFDKMKQFLKDVLDRKIRPTVKSMDAPLPSSPLASRNVKSITGNTFETIFDEDRDFMLVLTAPKGSNFFPGCTACEGTIQMLEIVAPRIEAIVGPVLRFGEFLVTANEIPLFDWGGTWAFDELPVIYLIKARTKVPIEYKGKMNSQSILEFWEKHTEIAGVKEKHLSVLIQEDRNVNHTTTTTVAPREEL